MMMGELRGQGPSKEGQGSEGRPAPHGRHWKSEDTFQFWLETFPVTPRPVTAEENENIPSAPGYMWQTVLRQSPEETVKERNSRRASRLRGRGGSPGCCGFGDKVQVRQERTLQKAGFQTRCMDRTLRFSTSKRLTFMLEIPG